MKALGFRRLPRLSLLLAALRAMRSTLTICIVALLIIAYRQGGFEAMSFAEVRWRNPIFLFLGLFIWEAWRAWTKSDQTPPPA